MRRPPKQRPGFAQPQTLFFTHREASGSVEAVALTDRRIEVEAEAGSLSFIYRCAAGVLIRPRFLKQ